MPSICRQPLAWPFVWPAGRSVAAVATLPRPRLNLQQGAMWIHLWALINPHRRALPSGRSADGWAAGAASPAAHPVHLSLVVGARGPGDLRLPVLGRCGLQATLRPHGWQPDPHHPRSCCSRSGRVLGAAVLLKAGRGRPQTPAPAGHGAGAGRLAQQAERWAACGGRGLEDRALRAQQAPSPAPPPVPAGSALRLNFRVGLRLKRGGQGHVTWFKPALPPASWENGPRGPLP